MLLLTRARGHSFVETISVPTRTAVPQRLRGLMAMPGHDLYREFAECWQLCRSIPRGCRSV